MANNIFVLGELNVDLIMTGEDVMPEWNKEKLLSGFSMVLGSSSAITACGLAGLGQQVYFVSVVGDDHYGRFCLEALEKMKVDTRYVVVDPNRQTGVTLSLSTEQDRALLTYMGAISELSPEHLPQEMYEQADHIHFGSYYLQRTMRDHWSDVFREAVQRGISTSFDTGWDIDEQWHRDQINELLPWTTLFIPSEVELNRIYGAERPEQALEQLPEGNGAAAVKRGAAGALYRAPSGECIQMPAFNVVPIDTTGAGDSFNAGFIYSYLNGDSPERCLQFASACGALATQRIGGASSVPSVADVEQFIQRQQSL
ncbi:MULTISPECIES: carbohydrate kinase family protein [unclassified Paenibacillus]|uniref:carbohydrate kinase family protein n=1 Tax=unclassified Paenibacillus TaxID=185978 RepID=UPI001C10F605|nr:MULTISPECIES: carbohydrate kinase family protein [unclassified Paenibacillus]MBU5444424.1 carbohydrate kinase family protein [Paenibacillus sp. MSJ-34]CAH0120148.1 2-dehydro-3-deoxygluconokinase [Paenibacillus sp. CECT 9249]